MRPPTLSGAVLLRPHHVLCAIGWQGHGYSSEFTQNMNAVVIDCLRADPETEVVFTHAADAICGPCPSRRGSSCRVADRIALLDARHGEALGIAPGQRMRWAEAQSRAVDRLVPADLERICKDCKWLELGLCQSALARLQESRLQEAK